ncbi:DMT family transporter [Candidatus Woesearchaeota archaeon]|nr:DMT family transporter [Candidatus Woesearchaeota archaeon]
MKRGYLFVLLTALISGISIFLNKFGVKGINPYVFTFSKNVLVVLFLFSALLFFKEFKLIKKLSKNQWLKLVAIGFFGGSVPFLLFFKGLSISASGSSSLIHKSMFIFVAILAFLLLKEKINLNFIIAAVLLFTGNLLLLITKSFTVGFGEILILASVLLWSLETIISKNALKELPSGIVAFGRMFFGVLFIFVFLITSGNIINLITLSIPQLSWVFFTATLLLLYIITWYAGLKRIPASSAASILVLGSAVTTTASMFYAGSFSLVDTAGIVLIGMGIITIIGYGYFASKIKFLTPFQN